MFGVEWMSVVYGRDFGGRLARVYGWMSVGIREVLLREGLGAGRRFSRRWRNCFGEGVLGVSFGLEL